MVETTRQHPSPHTPSESPLEVLPKDVRALRSFVLMAAIAFVSGLVIVAVRIAARANVAFPSATPQGLVVWQWVIVAMVLLGAFGLLIRAVSARAFVDILWSILLFFGVWVWCWGVMPWDLGLLVASLLTLIQARVRRVIVHDVFLCIGCAGVGIQFAFLLPVKALLLALVGLSVYDMVATRPHGLTQALAGALIHRGVVPGLIIPEALSSFAKDIQDVIRSPFGTFMGAGDLILPMTLVARSAVWGWIPACAVAFGAVIGASLLGRRKSLKPFPALLPLLGGSGLVFVSLFLFFER